MKRTLILSGILLLLFTGCAKQEQYPPGNTPVRNSTNSAGDALPNSGGTTAVELPETYIADGKLPEYVEGEIIEISEKLFIAQTNDIYLNADDYLGKTIKYEGIYQAVTLEGEDSAEDKTHHYVIRYGPGCCGDDGNAGFEVAWDGQWPQDNDWVEAIGVLELYDHNGWFFLQLRLDSLTVKEERGAEFVAM